VLKLSQGGVLASFIACNPSTQPFVSFYPFGQTRALASPSLLMLCVALASVVQDEEVVK
jgi:hypothetical protein